MVPKIYFRAIVATIIKGVLWNQFRRRRIDCKFVTTSPLHIAVSTLTIKFMYSSSLALSMYVDSLIWCSEEAQSRGDEGHSVRRHDITTQISHKSAAVLCV